ncbi:MAG: DUF3224 domain-containing protein [Coriobacteriia bacterium]|nr:DUF3224 domain-containing protein [Coriobacteriia bacterium]
MEVKSEFSVAKWDEEKCGGPVGDSQVTRASAIYEVSGAIDGKLDVEYLVHYTDHGENDRHASTATYIGYLTFSGSIEGKSGTLVLEDHGEYSPAGPVSELMIKPGTGTGELTGISGTGHYSAEGEKMILELNYDLR